MSDPITVLNDYRRRILQANTLRSAGDEEGALKLEPSPEELREALFALRSVRGTSAGLGKKKEPTIDPNANLGDLFGKKG